MEESKSKACEPATKMIFLGILFDSVKMSLEVTPERLQEIRTLVSVWLRKSNATKKEVQSLIGKLSFVSSCVRPGRVFIQSMLVSCVRFISLSLSHILFPIISRRI